MGIRCCKCQSDSTESLPRQSSNASIKSTPRTPQKTKDINKEEFAKQCLERHNEYRAKHKVQSLKLNTELSAFAQDWADHLASTQKMVHRPNNKYGENLWMMMTTDRSYKVNGGDAVDSWYQELDKYKFGTEPKNLDAAIRLVVHPSSRFKLYKIPGLYKIKRSSEQYCLFQPLFSMRKKTCRTFKYDLLSCFISLATFPVQGFLYRNTYSVQAA
ncbi:hypothetical protein J6590_027540 [Homalodisca vitripennis]|nr:hypothetical protein J6590_027540 [Homalodisca vitripennis]